MRSSAVAIKELSDWDEHSRRAGLSPALTKDRARARNRTVNPKRILAVEDNIDSARSLAFLLHEMGHRAEYAINGYAGLAAFKVFKPHVVLLDLGLPGMSGFEFCTRLRRLEDGKSARVIVISAYNSPEDRERSHALGCEAHLVKPVPPEVLEDLLR
jgi:CheY-like chemotaxis protein